MAGKTNVPQEIRDLWTDAYVLFDSHYMMEDTQDNWEGLAKDFALLYIKHHYNERFADFYDILCRMIVDRMEVQKNG